MSDDLNSNGQPLGLINVACLFINNFHVALACGLLVCKSGAVAFSTKLELRVT